MKHYTDIDSLLEDLENPTPGFLKDLNKSFDLFIEKNYPELLEESYTTDVFEAKIDNIRRIMSKTAKVAETNPLIGSYHNSVYNSSEAYPKETKVIEDWEGAA